MKVSISIDINNSPEVVFQWLEKPEKAQAWMTSVAKTEITLQTPEMVGTTFREIIEENGKGLEMQGIVTGFEPGKSISFHLNSRIHTVDVEHRVEKSSGGTRLTQNAIVRWKFPMNLISLILGAKIRRGITDQAYEELKKLKELCEKGSLKNP